MDLQTHAQKIFLPMIFAEGLFNIQVARKEVLDGSFCECPATTYCRGNGDTKMFKKPAIPIHIYLHLQKEIPKRSN
jgi:hypothetical protein